MIHHFSPFAPESVLLFSLLELLEIKSHYSAADHRNKTGALQIYTVIKHLEQKWKAR